MKSVADLRLERNLVSIRARRVLHQSMMPSHKPTTVIVRAYRLSRAALHVIEGLATTIVVFPFIGRATKHRLIRRWSRRLLPFHGSLIQPAIAAGGHVVPAAIRYMHADGTISDAASYVGEQSLIAAVLALVSAPKTRVRLHLDEPFATTGLHRRQVAERAH